MVLQMKMTDNENRYFHGSKFLYHIQDLHIEAAQDLEMIKSITNLLFKIEKYMLNKCDVINTISGGMVKKVRTKTMKDVLLFSNWTDVNSFYPIEDKVKLMQKFSSQASNKIVMYSGAIDEKQGLDSILAIADQLRNLSNLKFIICGSGPYLEELENLAEQLKLKNVNFMPLQAYSEYDFLNLADVHLVIQKARAGDLVMPFNLTTIIAAGGLAIITANPGSGLHSLVAEHRIGVLVGAENTNNLKECILQVVSNDFMAVERNAPRYAEGYLSTDEVVLCYERHIQKGNADHELNDTFARRPAVCQS